MARLGDVDAGRLGCVEAFVVQVGFVHDLGDAPSFGLRSVEDRAVQRVHLKVPFAPFFTFTGSAKLGEPTFDAKVITQTA